MTAGPTTSALELAAALRRRELSSVELLDACLAAVDAHNDDVNAVVWRDDDAARAAARSADAALERGDDAAFLGVPIPIKDLTPVAGWPVTYGSRGGPEGISEVGELTTEAFKRAGFVLCGRTNTPEFGPITVTENERYGITRNPWDLDRTPGGSSGGAAAAVAAGMFPLAHATDGGGSIRIPAACCGLVGLKPSRGRVPRLAQGWLGGVVEGAVTRTVADTAAVLDVLSGPDPRAWYNAPAPDRPFLEEAGREPARLRIGLMDHGPGGLPVEEPCAEAARRAAAALEELGHEVVPADVPTLSEDVVAPFLSSSTRRWPSTRASTGTRSSRTSPRRWPTPARRRASTTRPRPGSSSATAARWSRPGARTSTCSSPRRRRSCRRRPAR
jgi:amidase